MVIPDVTSDELAVSTTHTTAVQIREVACRLFARHGYDKTSVASIASEVGIVEGAVYRHFPSKRDLLHRVIQAFYEPLIDSVELGASAISDPKDRLHYLIQRHLQAFTEDPAVCRLVISEARSMDDYYESAVADLSRRYTSLVVQTYSEGADQGVFRPDLPPALVRDLIFGCVEHLAWGVLTGTHPTDLASMTDFVFTAVCSGVSVTSEHKAPELTQLERLERAADQLEGLIGRTGS